MNTLGVGIGTTLFSTISDKFNTITHKPPPLAPLADGVVAARCCSVWRSLCS